MTRVSDSDRDVYGDWVVRVVNSTRIALRANMLMSEGELAIIREVQETLNKLDPNANQVARRDIIDRPTRPRANQENSNV